MLNHIPSVSWFWGCEVRNAALAEVTRGWLEELQWTKRKQRELRPSKRINVGLASTVATFIPVEHGTIRYVSDITERPRPYRSSAVVEHSSLLPFTANIENAETGVS